MNKYLNSKVWGGHPLTCCFLATFEGTLENQSRELSHVGVTRESPQIPPLTVPMWKKPQKCHTSDTIMRSRRGSRHGGETEVQRGGRNCQGYTALGSHEDSDGLKEAPYSDHKEKPQLTLLLQTLRPGGYRLPGPAVSVSHNRGLKERQEEESWL